MKINLGFPSNLYTKNTRQLKHSYTCKIFTSLEKLLQPEISELLNSSSDLTKHFWFDLEESVD